MFDIPAYWLFALIFVYPLLQAALLRLTRGARDTFADSARNLLQDPTVSEQHKQFISSMTDDLFDWRFMAFATVYFPFLALSGRAAREMKAEDRVFMAREDVGNLIDAHIKSVMAASPFFTVTFIAVAVVTLALAFIFKGITAFSVLWGDTIKHVSPTVGSNKHTFSL